MMRVSKIVRVMMEDETELPFKNLTVEPGKSWRNKARAFKNAGWIEAGEVLDEALALGDELSAHEGNKVWDAHVGGAGV